MNKNFFFWKWKEVGTRGSVNRWLSLEPSRGCRESMQHTKLPIDLILRFFINIFTLAGDREKTPPGSLIIKKRGTQVSLFFKHPGRTKQRNQAVICGNSVTTENAMRAFAMCLLFEGAKNRKIVKLFTAHSRFFMMKMRWRSIKKMFLLLFDCNRRIYKRRAEFRSPNGANKCSWWLLSLGSVWF